MNLLSDSPLRDSDFVVDSSDCCSDFVSGVNCDSSSGVNRRYTERLRSINMRKRVLCFMLRYSSARAVSLVLDCVLDFCSQVEALGALVCEPSRYVCGPELKPLAFGL